MGNKKINVTEPQIKIRILKALSHLTPVGVNKHVYMIKVLRNMKKPNIITPENIWNFINDSFHAYKYDKEDFKQLLKQGKGYEETYSSIIMPALQKKEF